MRRKTEPNNRISQFSEGKGNVKVETTPNEIVLEGGENSH